MWTPVCIICSLSRRNLLEKMNLQIIVISAEKIFKSHCNKLCESLSHWVLVHLFGTILFCSRFYGRLTEKLASSSEMDPSGSWPSTATHQFTMTKASGTFTATVNWSEYFLEPKQESSDDEVKDNSNNINQWILALFTI